MRLTNVSQMTLPLGELHVFDVRADAASVERLPISFDQRRHVGAGERPGSWMAISLRVPLGTTKEQVADAWIAVIARHGALNTAFTRGDTGELELREHTMLVEGWRQHPIPVDSSARDELRAVFDKACTPFSRPSHQLTMLLPADGDRRPFVVIGSDHSHVDMWSLLIIARDLRVALDATLPAEAASSFAEHSAVLERMPPAPDTVVNRWQEILAAGDGGMPTFPLPLGDVSQPRAEVVEVRDVLDATGWARFEEAATAQGVRATAVALSVLTEVTRRLADQPMRAVFPVHSRQEPRWHDSVGWFITNAVIECTDATPVACAAAMKEALVLGSHPLAPIFAPYGGMPDTPGMFALSWLDGRRLPPVPGDLEIQYVSAVIRTDGVMVWFIVNEAGLHMRCRYPETPEARTSLALWLGEVERGLQQRAGRIPG